ncbi:VOC family protein [Lonsdalea quercina]|uniref:VOC family protein n=1 Tax=Lonsdalea quercina TaxID=71657 RepID=UPI0039759EBD
MMTLTLDHVVLNARFDTDRAAFLLQQLGFTLTPRGRHSLGSINHLLMFDGHYLEVLGLPPDEPPQRRELLDGPGGLDGLVFGSQDIEASAASLQQAGFATLPVSHFSRPVMLDGRLQAARFSTVHLAAGRFSAGRLYFCQHHTPELVWRDDWLRHPNGVARIGQLTVVGRDPDALAQQYRALGALTPRFSLAFLSHDTFAQGYSSLIALDVQRDSRFAALRFHGGDRRQIAASARTLGLPLSERPEQLVVSLPMFNTLFEFLP